MSWPEFRRLEIQKAAQVLADAMVVHIDQMTTTCAACSSYNHEEEVCMKFNIKPPARVIVVGCEHFEGDIPF